MLAATLGVLVIVIIGLKVWSHMGRTPQRFPALPGTGKLEAARIRYRALCARHGFQGTIPNAQFVLLKSKRLLVLLSGSEKLETYQVAFGPKRREAVPLGGYAVLSRESRTDYHLLLAVARTKDTSASAFAVHGGRKGQSTDGHVALRNEAMEEIWHVAGIGTPVSVQP